MTRRMLIDATQPEEMRVAVVNGNKLEEYDYETEFRKQLKGNIYLAKVTRVEPSLQAAFVEYGGNRHAFLPFPEIHTDYYRIPVGDRPHDYVDAADEEDGDDQLPENAFRGEALPAVNDSLPDEISQAFESVRQSYAAEEAEGHDHGHSHDYEQPDHNETAEDFQDGEPASEDTSEEIGEDGHAEPIATPATKVETVGGDDDDEMPARRRSAMPRYKIQEVIKRRQIMLIQIAKEERGNKGAAVTTFLSLPGRYCVLMPNTPRGGGISRKIANPQDRKRMKDLIGDLELPPGMSVILRTAGVERTKVEIKRDLDYLLRLWEAIRDLTLQSTAPALVYEEGNLIKRSIRDIYNKDISEILVAGETGYRQAKDFMRMLMPAHARRVQLYREAVPMFFRFSVESQIDMITNPVAQLRSGGYIVINQTEALVSIDVNSGRSTRERNIEETAYKTNLEAAEEIARQLRLRDMGGLIVIDFIDMEDSRHDNAVERRLKDAMRHDRARIQIGRMSAFGLLELSRQRLHPSLLESNFHTCAACRGTGIVRSLESAAFVALRAMEEEGIKAKSAEIVLYIQPDVAMYVLNNKRRNLMMLEEQYAMKISITADSTLISPDYRIERIRAQAPGFISPVMSQVLPPMIEDEDPIEEEIAEAEEEFEGSSEVDGEASGASRRGNRRRRGRGSRRPNERNSGERGEHHAAESDEASSGASFGGAESEDGETPFEATAEQPDFTYPAEALPGAETGPRTGRRRRGRRGGRRRHAGTDQASDQAQEDSFAEQDSAAVFTEGENKSFASYEAQHEPAYREAEPAFSGSQTASESALPAEAPPSIAESQSQAAGETTQPVTRPAPKRDFETVNPEPEAPKNGWWKRLID